MGANFRVCEAMECYSRIGVYVGTAAHWRRCKVCSKTIKANNPLLSVHSFGEMPTCFHPACAAKLAKTIIKFAKK